MLVRAVSPDSSVVLALGFDLRVYARDCLFDLLKSFLSHGALEMCVGSDGFERDAVRGSSPDDSKLFQLGLNRQVQSVKLFEEQGTVSAIGELAYRLGRGGRTSMQGRTSGLVEDNSKGQGFQVFKRGNCVFREVKLFRQGDCLPFSLTDVIHAGALSLEADLPGFYCVVLAGDSHDAVLERTGACFDRLGQHKFQGRLRTD